MFDLTGLNDTQKEAVLHTEGPLLILAGAGSGKTRVITYRIAHLIKEKGVSPKNILAITFTNKAANEMKERVQELVGQDSMGIWIGTFHATCVRILRKHIDKLGYNNSFVIYDASDQKSLIKDCLKELDYNEKNFPPKYVQSEISKAKNDLIDNKLYYKRWQNDFRLSKIANIYNLYQKKLSENNALDFDDLIFKTIELFNNHSDILEYYQNKFKYILIDEYQDTNVAQYELVSLLARAHENLCVVGDDDQSIYGWRGANIYNILDFEKEFKHTKVAKLEQNYRSTQNILNAANNVIKNNDGRKTKKLWTQGNPGELITFYTAMNEHDEADYVVNEITKKISGNEANYNDFAILYRTNAQSRVFEETFIKRSIPYRIIGGQKYFDRKEIKDIMAYLRVIQNPDDSVSLKRIINVPKRGIGNTTINKLEEYAYKNNTSLYQALKNLSSSDRAYNKVNKFVNLIEEFNTQSHTISVSKLIDNILDKTDYIKVLEQEGSSESQSRIENLKEFISVALDFEKNNEDQSLEEFLASISLVSDTDNLEGQENAVVLMTLHSAKGLEYPNVFVSGMDEGIFPSFKSSMDESELEEERRLCYVGITRARQKLYITSAKQRTIYGTTSHYSPSRFIKEIPESLIEENETNKFMNLKSNNNGSIFSKNFKDRFNNSVKDTSTNSQSYNIGDTVEHHKFGAGTILDIQSVGNDTMLKIAFSDIGTKQIMAGYANLKVIS